MRIAGVALGLASLLATACDAKPARRPETVLSGAAACVECHAQAANAWRASPHGSTGTAVATPPGGADGAVGAVWMQAYYRRGARGLHEIVPECFDRRTKQWRAVPEVLAEISGEQRASGTSHVIPLESRTFETDCAGCHASQPRHRLDVVTGQMESRWVDASINCQACHGRGDEHVKAWRRLSPDAPMPRLEDLSPRAKTGVCARCHGGPSAEAEFQPSDAAYYIGHLQDRPDLFPDGRAAGLTYQQPSFVRSLCHAKGGLSCTDCHDAHGNGLRKGADTDALCVRCHPGLASREHTFHEASGAGARCIECHMPRLLTGLMAHQHDHRIGIPLPAVEEVPDACTACHKDKTKGWADAAWRARWGEPPAATIEAVRGIVLMRAHDPAAGPLLRAALTSPDPYFRANAIRGLDEPAAGLDDPVPEVRFVAFEVAAASPKHAAVLRKFLQDPEPVIRGWCEAELATRGTKPDPGWRADLEIAVRMSRGWGPGNVTLGMLRLWAGDAEGAVSAFRAAATYSPAIEDAWAGLSRSLHTVGRHAEADAVEAARTEAWRRALRPVRR